MEYSLSEPVFFTSRLRVFRMDGRPSEEHKSRAVFLAFLASDDCDHPIVNATVWIDCPYVGHSVCWIETMQSYRQAGIAKELRLGIVDYLGAPLQSTPVSESGKLFLENILRTNPEAVSREAWNE